MHKSIFSFRWQSVASWPERLNTAAPVCFSSNLDGTLRSACWVVISQKNESHACSPCFGLWSRPFRYKNIFSSFSSLRTWPFFWMHHTVFSPRNSNRNGPEVAPLSEALCTSARWWVSSGRIWIERTPWSSFGPGKGGCCGMVEAQPRAPPAPRDRVVDKYNAKVFRVRFEKQEDVVRLQEPLPLESLASARMTRKTA